MTIAGSVAFLAAVALVCAGTATARAQERTVKIGVLSDMSSLFSENSGPGSLVAAKLAVEDFNPAAKGLKVEIVSADHQNKADIGANIARQWFDVDHVDAIVDMATSSVALAVSELAREKNKVLLVSAAATSDLTGQKCSPNTIHWSYDTWMLAHSTGKAMVTTGGDTWFFITADYAFGQALERDTTAVILANGGKVLGSVRHPINVNDFSSFLLQAQASKAKVVGLANAGGDTVNAIKQSAEFGLSKGGQQLAGLLVFIADVNALGLEAAQGLVLTASWYWDMTEGNRAFTKRWRAERPGRFPTMVHAGVYASVIHYLKTVAALKSDADGRTVIAKMKATPINDFFAKNGYIREDGRMVHDMYLVEAKKPSESKGDWDLYNILATIPGDQAFRPMADGGCPFVKK